MRTKLRQSGASLMEMTVVVAIMSLLIGLSLPGIRAFYNSFESGGGTRSMVSAAMASARAIAAKEQRYAGIRFQKVYDRDAVEPNDPLTAPQYMIFIIHDPTAEPNGTGLANGFRAVKGIKPVKLPDSVGVMDYSLIEEKISLDPDWEFDGGTSELRDLTTFSIVFSPSGKLVIHEVRVRNRKGKRDSSLEQSLDDIFNTEKQITNTVTPRGMFYQDDYTAMGLGQEFSRRGFIIYDSKEFKQAYETSEAYSEYLSKLNAENFVYINAYTGAMISMD